MVCLGTAGSNNCFSPLILSLLLGCLVFSFLIQNQKGLVFIILRCESFTINVINVCLSWVFFFNLGQNAKILIPRTRNIYQWQAVFTNFFCFLFYRKEMLKMQSKPLRNMSLKWAKCIDKIGRVYSGLKLKTQFLVILQKLLVS